MRAAIFFALWLWGCTDKPVDSDPTETDTGDCAAGYDAETFVNERLAQYCAFASTCPDVVSTEEQCFNGLRNLVFSTPCYQPCNARACIDQINAVSECSSHAADAPLCDRIVQCPDEQ